MIKFTFSEDRTTNPQRQFRILCKAEGVREKAEGEGVRDREAVNEIRDREKKTALTRLTRYVF